MKPEHVTIGIDLGTTNTCIAIVRDGLPQIVEDPAGNKTTPSMVAFNDNHQRLVGYTAKRQSVVNAKNTIYSSKRILGHKWDSEIRVAMEQNSAFTLLKAKDDTISVLAQGVEYSSTQISSMILAEMKLIAEQSLGHSVNNAVITVPAYFNDAQRQATKAAGRMAGLDVLRILNEPTAAALAYGFDKSSPTRKKKLAVYDLGGGTFDISILEYSNGIYEVISTAGDTFLGGEDFDKRVVEWMVEEFYGRFTDEIFNNPMTKQRLKEAAEKARWDLSETTSAEINLPFLFSDNGTAHHLKKILTREKLEELTIDLIERTINICMSTLNDAYMNPRSIDEVLLVGGMTRMPKVRQMTESFFGRQASSLQYNPDEVVAKGAAVQGYSLVSGGPQTVLLDVTPHSLGIMIAGGFFKKLIEKNTSVPCRHTESFTTVRDSQTEVKIYILQGESFKAEENSLLGEFVLDGLAEAARGQVEVTVSFEISADGIVSVSAIDTTSGRKRSIRVLASHQMSEEDMSVMLDQNLDYVLQAKADKEFEKKKQSVELDLRHIYDLRPQVESILEDSSLGHGVLEKANEIIASAEEALETKDLSKLIVAAPALQRTRQTFRQVIERANT